jgi:hypothetical protein
MCKHEVFYLTYKNCKHFWRFVKQTPQEPCAKSGVGCMREEIRASNDMAKSDGYCPGCGGSMVAGADAANLGFSLESQLTKLYGRRS